ncbi:hypothetical protein HNY73_003679 [Argiope bruennichi]|uniref:Uncharacterized protein n=1 Tax=Argiope bruennichi TaxID=94029 RepID=A0A8T0FPC6_ARGBR|nr:hypothetical protein HNY73_003679 [Argiope bruennichi]
MNLPTNKTPTIASRPTHANNPDNHSPRPPRPPVTNQTHTQSPLESRHQRGRASENTPEPNKPNHEAAAKGSDHRVRHPIRPNSTAEDRPTGPTEPPCLSFSLPVKRTTNPTKPTPPIPRLNHRRRMAYGAGGRTATQGQSHQGASLADRAVGKEGQKAERGTILRHDQPAKDTAADNPRELRHPRGPCWRHIQPTRDRESQTGPWPTTTSKAACVNTNAHTHPSSGGGLAPP